ncbi:UDP-N-acetylmuramate--L-alanine ligase [Microbispora triticiradicis]|uniref:UDP-N-acetylmuramate--L-alanine ligase n=3 Tax=Microbispora TaxID=2005 RepID=A0ABY3LYI6_9ACTN|nr:MULTISPECIES: UDP-N-acetylmuramate--L-alanine ligase [Microbispora]RGA03479.1 UDP-N-acetylmuramate--L-alanine ligase [Microbispora triticiradicis]TLP55087.1 UDP-N-acetylmuramate--L-alanine ligase [Microbispora fusca]TYB59994.1 UDP-N-acetylmuramate--L-alanine ligase [Microbispora tritici]GLW21016.1 UDP-N-acetylmuramate--L-alanine ligase [Microbispora amethystogenes]
MSLVKLVDPVPAADLGRVHFIGIGGAGMSGIARILLKRGVPVSGSDARPSAQLTELREMGATVHVGHAASHIKDVDTVVVSTAIRDSNPELGEALRQNLRVIPRAAALASVMSGRTGIAVAGTHGKTTTTSMLTVALQKCGEDPSYCVGGQLVTTGLGADDGTGEVFVAEADESDGSFLMLAPRIAVVTNVEADHLDNYGDPQAVHDGFARFVEHVGSLLVVCADDPGAAALVPIARERGLTVVTYGESAGVDLRTTDVAPRGLGVEFRVELGPGAPGGPGRGEVRLAVPGRHNAVNATAVIAVALHLGLRFDDVKEGLAAFTGAKRRFESKGEAGGVTVFDSYAHHPTELTADLRAARDVVGGDGRVIAVFQPHLYSRTRFFADEFGAALGLADEVVVLDVYGAREDPEPGVSGALVAGKVPLPAERVVYAPDRAAVPALVAGRAHAGDIVLTMGAGDVTELGPRIVAELSAR